MYHNKIQLRKMIDRVALIRSCSHVDNRLTYLALLDTISIMNTKNDNFGEFIQAARNKLGLSLRAVEEATGISNAYLSQLEQGKIKRPSPGILYKLSDVYKVPYADLFRLVGYPLPNTSIETKSATLASRIGPITQDEEESLIEYLEFLRSRNQR
jgi:transcriptional regulator with XRE-family HTH domain